MAQFRYFPILRWKEGEQEGVRLLASRDKENVFPIFVLGSDQYKEKKETKTKPLVIAADHFAAQVARVWGTQPFYLDASALSGGPGAHPIIAIAAAAKAAGLNMAPATPLGASPSYASAVTSVAKSSGNGLALRVDLQEFTSVSTWLSTWPLPLQETDLIADFSSDISSIVKLGPIVNSVFAGLHNSTNWRTVTIAGSSMPDNFAGIAKGLYTINMETYTLWQTLKSSVSYVLNYGDYATPPSGVLPPGIAWGYPINVRYTLPGQYLICKGVKTKGITAVAMGPQLTGHAKDIMNYPGRHRLTGCWADDEIDAIAGGKSPQQLLHWVKIGVNRHLTLMRRIIP